jgi:quercetin 2,3-dioxygenase
VHAEMFPLLNADQTNPLELFQIWLNLPAKNKMVKPHFTMLWSEQIPRATHTDAQGHATDIAVVAGSLYAAGSPVQPLAPPPDSWAAHESGDVAIWTIKMQSGARYTLPAAAGQGTQRTVYFFKGTSISVDGQLVNQHAALQLRADFAAELINGDGPAELLVLQGKPIAEPVAQYGPFVMNTQAEIHQAMADYRATEFGGWPWPDSAPVHGRESTRFARHPDGRLDKPLVT